MLGIGGNVLGSELLVLGRLFVSDTAGGLAAFGDRFGRESSTQGHKGGGEEEGKLHVGFVDVRGFG